VITNSGDSPLTDLTVRRSGAGIVGRVPSLGAGTRITLIATDRLGAEHIQTDHILVSGTDRSGRRVSATATTTITVFTARVRDHRPSTAFTGSWATDRVTAAAVLLVIGVGMLVLGRRRCALPSRN
jgi:hypothetical protein